MRKFLSNPAVHRACMIVFALSTCTFGALLMTGCGAPAWLNDAINLIPLLVSGATSVLSFIAAISGNVVPAALLTEISTIATKVEAGLKNIEALVEQYKSDPSDSLLQNIEAAVQLAIGDINQFFAVEGLPAAIGQKITAFAQLILDEVENLASLIPVLKSTVTAHATVTVKFPLSSREFKAKFNALLAPSGDAVTDAALAKVHRL